MIMPSFFDRGMTFIWQPQNDGQPIHNTAGDPGGATSWGVTFKNWCAWQDQHGEPADYHTFATLQKEEFLPLYNAWFWNAARCGSFGAAGVVLFDTAVLSGPGRSIRLLQQTAGVTVDGIAGPRTIAAAAGMDMRSLVKHYTDARLAFLKSLPGYSQFPGWVTRATRCRDFTLSLMGA